LKKCINLEVEGVQENMERGCGKGCEWFALKTKWCYGSS